MRIFVSYSQQDSVVTNKLSVALRAAGHKLWKWDESIRPGDNIAKKTMEAIRAADAFLLVVSSNSLASKAVLQEFSTLAMSEVSKRDLRIIPVIIDSAPIPGYLNQYLYIDISQNVDAGVARVVAFLAEPFEQDSTNSTAITAGPTSVPVVELAKSLQTGRLTLVCGAGISVDADVPMWGDLLLALLQSMVERLSREHSIGTDTNAAPEFQRRYGGSSLILGKYFKNTLGKDFSRTVRDALYAKNPRTSDLIDSIIELARPRRESKALDAIVTFNFDALIEENLNAARISNRSIYTESVKHDPHEIPIYHVHGFLPRKGRIPESTEIVLSEDAYHDQFLDPFSWSNLIQLSKFSQNRCLFVGVSLTDPNLRRLLDVSWRKSSDKIRRHFIVKRLPNFDEPTKTIDRLAQILEEQDANLLGMNVIWVKEYAEIPALLRSIVVSGT